MFYFRYWLQFADYYRWPYVTVFDSWPDLIQKLQTLDLRKLSDSMRAFNKIRQGYVLDNWCRLLKSLPQEQPIPTSYDEALEYFNMSSIQIFN